MLGLDAHPGNIIPKASIAEDMVFAMRAEQGTKHKWNNVNKKKKNKKKKQSRRCNAA
jgi:hypothetical protein